MGDLINEELIVLAGRRGRRWYSSGGFEGRQLAVDGVYSGGDSLLEEGVGGDSPVDVVLETPKQEEQLIDFLRKLCD